VCVRHGELHERIAAVDRELEAAPADASLYLERAELLRLHVAWDRALRDIARAAELDPTLVDVEFARARLYADMGWSELARESVDTFLEARPLEAAGFFFSSRLFEAQGRLGAAHAHICRGIELSARPEPDYFLRRADLAAALWSGDVPRVVEGLDAGIERIGSVVALELRAMDLLRGAEQWDAALVRLERVASRSARKERWLAVRGDILHDAGRTTEAHTAFEQARRALALLRPAQRRSRAMRALAAHIQSALTRSDSK